MAIISDIAQQKKFKYFFKDVPSDARILEVGCSNKWLGELLEQNGWNNYEGLDLEPPADIVGDIRDWKKLGLKPNTYDVIVALEVVEHVHCFEECYALLKPNGKFIITSPVPHMDFVCKALEAVGLNQKRTSPHDHLIYFEEIPLFKPEEIKRKAFISQWGVFTK